MTATPRPDVIAGPRFRPKFFFPLLWNGCQVVNILFDWPRPTLFILLGLLLTWAHSCGQDIACVGVWPIESATHFKWARLILQFAIHLIYLVHQALNVSFILLFFRLRELNLWAFFSKDVGHSPWRKVLNLRYPLVAWYVVKHMTLEPLNFLSLLVNNCIFFLDNLMQVFNICLIEHWLILNTPVFVFFNLSFSLLHLLMHKVIKLLVLLRVLLPSLHHLLFLFVGLENLLILLINLRLQFSELFFAGLSLLSKKFHDLLHFFLHGFKNVSICHCSFSVWDLRVGTLSNSFRLRFVTIWLIKNWCHAWCELVLLKVSSLGSFGRAGHWTLLRCFFRTGLKGFLDGC